MSRCIMSACEVQEKCGRYLFDHVDTGILATQVRDLFAQQGYALEEGTQLAGTYGTGSAVARALIGVFAKRYKYNVNISTEGPTTLLSVEPAMTGVSGGVIGYQKTKDETRRILAVVEEYFPRAEDVGQAPAPVLVAPPPVLVAPVPVVPAPAPAPAAAGPKAAGGAIMFRCPSCGAAIRTPRSAAGTRGKCPKCRAVCDVPQAPEIAVADVVAQTVPAVPAARVPSEKTTGGQAASGTPAVAVPAAKPARKGGPIGYILCCLPLVLIILGWLMGHTAGLVIGVAIGLVVSAANILIYRTKLKRPVKAAIFAGGGVAALILTVVITVAVALAMNAIHGLGSDSAAPTPSNVEPKAERNRTVTVRPKPPAPPVGPGQWVDLVQGSDPKWRAVSGTWSLTNGVLTNKSGELARVQLPVSPTGDYELSLVFNRKAGGKEFAVQFPVAGKPAVIHMGTRDGQTSLIDGSPGEQFRGAPKILDGRDQHLEIKVQTTGESANIAVSLDGAPYHEYKSLLARLAANRAYTVPSGVGLAADPGVTMEFKAIRIRALSGQIEPLKN